MKKVIATLLSIFLTLSFVSVVTYGNLPGGSDSIDLGHNVDKVSEFVVRGKNVSKFESTSSIEVASVSLDNNTRDGYALYLSTTHGVLRSGTSAHGEEDIAYNLSKTQSGNSPEGSDSFLALTIPASPPTTQTLILGTETALSGDDLLTDPTEIDFTLKVNVISASFVDMAGNYSDTITLTYVDK
jgi:hypothetical protein